MLYFYANMYNIVHFLFIYKFMQYYNDLIYNINPNL